MALFSLWIINSHIFTSTARCSRHEDHTIDGIIFGVRVRTRTAFCSGNNRLQTACKASVSLYLYLSPLVTHFLSVLLSLLAAMDYMNRIRLSTKHERR